MRLIDADALINDRENFIVIGAGDNICIDIADIAKAPTIEAEPVKHGRWERIGIKGRKGLPKREKTNADRIRAMSDEELADMLWKTGRNYRAVCADPVVDYNEHRDNLIAWLKQPPKGE